MLHYDLKGDSLEVGDFVVIGGYGESAEIVEVTKITRKSFKYKYPSSKSNNEYTKRALSGYKSEAPSFVILSEESKEKYKNVIKRNSEPDIDNDNTLDSIV